MFQLAWTSLTTNKGRSFATGTAIAIGALLVALTLAGTATMRTAVDRGLAVEYQNTDVVMTLSEATGDGGLSAQSGTTSESIGDDEVATIADLPGVEAASGVVTAEAIAALDDDFRGATIETLPSDNRFVWQDLASGSWPASSSEVAVAQSTLDSMGLVVGDRLLLGTSTLGPAAFTITGAIDTSGSLRHEQLTYLVATPDVVRLLAGIDGYTSVKVDGDGTATPEELVTEINSIAPSGWPQTSDELIGGNADLYNAGLAMLQLVVLGLVGVALVVTAMVLATTFRVSLAARTRALGLQRCLGATRGQVIGSVVVEALLLGVIASVIGTLIGLALVAWGTPLLAGWLSAFSLDVVTIPWFSYVVPIVLGSALPVLAGLVPAWRASRVPPVAAVDADLAHAAPRRLSLLRGAAAAAVCLIGALTIGAGWIGGSWELIGVGGIVLAIGIIAGSAHVVVAAAGIAAALGRRGRWPTLGLAAAGLRRNPRQAASIGLAVLIAASLTTATWVALDTVRSTVHDRLASEPSVDVVVGDVYTNATLPDSTVTGLTQVAGVDTVFALYGTDEVTITGEPADVGATNQDAEELQELNENNPLVEGDGTDETVWDVTIATADATSLEQAMRVPYDIDEVAPDTVYLQATAYPPFEEGATVALNGPNGSVNATVAYVDDLDVPALASADLIAPLVGDLTIRAAWVKVDRSVDTADVLSGIRAQAVLADGAPVTGTLPVTAKIDAAIGLVRTTATGLLCVALVIAMIGLATTTALSTAARRRESALLRALGLDMLSLRRTLLLEAALVAAVAAVLGMVVGVVLGYAAGAALAAALGLELVVGVPWIALLVALVVPVVVARAATSGIADREAAVPTSQALAAA